MGGIFLPHCNWHFFFQRLKLEVGTKSPHNSRKKCHLSRKPKAHYFRARNEIVLFLYLTYHPNPCAFALHQSYNIM